MSIACKHVWLASRAPSCVLKWGGGAAKVVWDEDLHVKVMNRGKWAFYSVSMKYKAPYMYMVHVQMPLRDTAYQ